MKIDIYYSLVQRETECLRVDVPERTMLREAIPAGLAALMLSQGLTSSVWGRVVGFDYQLQLGDRVELVRELRVDPMTARRERFNKQGIKKAGLFKTKREGAKAGY
jgi:uncharacterized protein